MVAPRICVDPARPRRPLHGNPHLHRGRAMRNARRRRLPLPASGGTGLLLIFPSLIVLLFLMVRRLVLQIPVLGSPLFQMSGMLIILGFQSILMGLIAELLVRTYHESQAKPTYSVRRVINLAPR